jgi:hypothetical protein
VKIFHIRYETNIVRRKLTCTAMYINLVAFCTKAYCLM